MGYGDVGDDRREEDVVAGGFAEVLLGLDLSLGRVETRRCEEGRESGGETALRGGREQASAS